MEYEPIDKFDAEAVEAALVGYDPILRAWVWRMFLQGNLDLIANGLSRKNLARDISSVVSYLADFSKHAPEKVRVGRGDFDRKSSKMIFEELRKSLDLSQPQDANFDNFRRLGVMSHNAVPRLLSGEFASVLGSGVSTQLDLLDEIIVSPQTNGGLDWLKSMKRSKFREGLKRVINHWRYLKERLSTSNGNGYLVLSRYPNRIKMFYRTLEIVFGSHVGRLWQREIFEDEYLIFLTLMSWGAACEMYLTEGPKLMVREAAIFPPRFDLGGGRIDALAIEDMGRDVSKHLTAQELSRFSSVSFGAAVQALLPLLKKPKFVVKEWKFSVGDGVGSSVIVPHDIRERPPEAHVRQLLRYLSLGMLSYNLAAKRNQEELWCSDRFELEGELVYFLPQCSPIKHTVKITQEEREQLFMEDIAYPWKAAHRLARLRLLTNSIVRHVIGEILPQARKRKAYTKAQIVLPDIPNTSQGARELVEKYRHAHIEFADPDKIIEIIPVNGHSRYEMHIDRLLTAIGSDSIKHGRFEPETGGFICCLLHQEKTPSMRVALERGFFHCFGCGASGKFSTGTLPAHITVKTSSDLPAAWKKIPKTGAPITIPQQHQRIMEVARESMTSVFAGSVAERYLVRGRGIDSDLAQQFGVGYGSDKLIHDLLDAGFSYDDLLFYGFLELSERLGIYSHVPQLLLKRGLSPADIMRSGKAKEYPYSLLQERVTFPLELHGALVNFYGRDINVYGKKSMRHRKLSIERTGIPQGGFNMKAVREDHKILLVTEGTFDALTYIQAGSHTGTPAIIGVRNEVLMREIATFQGDEIALGFDNEENQTGAKATTDATHMLKAFGFGGPIWDFTARFLEAHPGIEYKDMNEHWLKTKERFTIQGAKA